MAMAPEIPLDIRDAMRDCILSVFWPKKKIIEFFESVGCPNEIVSAANLQTSRLSIIVETFSRLGARHDRGYDIFQVMLDRLSNWSYFDPYYFETIGKLDKIKAEQAINRLKRSVEQRNTTTSNRRAAASSGQRTEKSKSDLTALNVAFKKLFDFKMNVQERGRLFEKFLKNIFDRHSVPMGDPFRLVGEQIDGSFKFEGENYIVEAKWQDASTSTGQLYTFAMKVDGKMHGRGLFISVNGFSNESIKAFVQGKHIKAILMDGEDLSHVIEERITLGDMLDFKIRAAQTRGDVYVCPLRQTNKV